MEWLIGITTGIIAGLIVGGIYYYFSGRSLRKEARELARLNHLILLYLEKSGGKIVYDSDNVAVGIQFSASISGTSRIQKSQQQSIGGKSRIVAPENQPEPDPELDEWLEGK